MKKKIVLETLEKIEYNEGYFLIVPDAAAGSPDRFTVYRIPSSPSRRVRVIGRELPLGTAREVIRQFQEPT